MSPSGLRGVPFVFGLLLAACAGEQNSSGPSSSTPGLVDVTARLGLPRDGGDWPDGVFYTPEIMGTGVALFDYDGDGDLDLLHVRSPNPGTPEAPAPNRLYRQGGDGRFEDVTDASGVGDPGYGQGVAVGDVDGDGSLDVFFANYGADRLYLNRGDGTFGDHTVASGLEGERWASSAAFCDYDRDGDLDLFVVNYLAYRGPAPCHYGGGADDYCGPSAFDGVPDQLYRNEGGGRFRDVTREVGIVAPEGGRRSKGLGVVCVDLTGDGWLDFYVANDDEMNHLWVNDGGRFREEAILRGLAVNRHGNPEASMGVAVGDVDGDQHLDLFLTHLTQETNTLYRGSPDQLYLDRTDEAHFGIHDLPMTGFGCALLDFDHDGDLDLAVVNGRVRRGPRLAGARLGAFWSAYAEPDLLFTNRGDGVFEPRPGSRGQFGADLEVGRGLAVGDIDRDGDLDLVVSHATNTLSVFRNDIADPAAHWVSVRAVERGRDALGARVAVVAEDRSWLGVVLAASSYQSSSDPRAHFGLGDRGRILRVEVTWPDGAREVFEATEVDRELTLVRGTGVPA